MSATRSAYLSFGANNKCRVYIRERQIWEKMYETTDFVGLNRDSVDIEVAHKDFKRLFEEVKDGQTE